MGFKLKKKNGGDSAGLKKGGAFLENIERNWINFPVCSVKQKIQTDYLSCFNCFGLAVILLIYLFVSVPRSNQLTRSWVNYVCCRK